MNILGIDTSCDDTSAAVVGNGRQVFSSIVNSQVSIHHPYGGVVPELASREHVGSISSVVDRALQQATLSIEDLDAIAVTIGPGLVGALLVGLYYAKGICFSKRIPLIGVNHLEGHILSVFLEKEVPTFPFVVLTSAITSFSAKHLMMLRARLLIRLPKYSGWAIRADR